MAVEKRSQQLKQEQGPTSVHDVDRDPIPPPQVPANPSRGFQYEGIGADLALEICWSNFAYFPQESLQIGVKNFMRNASEMAVARVHSIGERSLDGLDS